jgi:glutamate synthase domain-containing protein 2
MYSQQRGLRRHTNADIVTKTKLVYPDHASQSGICSICAREGSCEIGRKAKEARTLFPEPFGSHQFGAEKRLPNLEDLQILPELFGEGVIFKQVDTQTEIGGFKVKAPLVIAALGSTKVAHAQGEFLAKGAAKAGIPMVIGESVLPSYGRKGLKERMKPYDDNRTKFGALVVQGNGHDIKERVFEEGKSLGADAIEIKLGQGAKQGLGGEVTITGDKEAKRYEKLGYLLIKNPDGTYQRHANPGSIKEEELRDLMIKKASLNLPIWVKTGIGRGILKLVSMLDRIKKEQGLPIKCLTVDGFGGGTGMSPWLVMNETSIPSGSLFSALRNKPDFDILLAGGYNTGFDVAKGMMLGSNGVAMGRAFLIAASSEKDKGIVNFVKAIEEELSMVCAIQRVNTVDSLTSRRKNLYALSEEAEKVFGISRKNEDIL